ncbi:MAG: hypothetical protein ABI156_13835 [Caldimonas sp.]
MAHRQRAVRDIGNALNNDESPFEFSFGLPNAAPRPSAHLLVHHPAEAQAFAWNFSTLVRRVRSLANRGDRVVVHLEIRDRDGCGVMRLSARTALIDVALPAGTYDVLASWTNVQKHFTVAIAPSRSLDLHLAVDRTRLS